MEGLKEKAVRGGLVKVCAQVANFILRIGSLMLLARLLDPKDFGLVGMVTAVTGIFGLLKDAGLSAATIQRASITNEQISALFWINMLVGIILALMSLLIAPILVAFYEEPLLFWLTWAIGLGFILNAAGVQHTALLQRQMKFVALAIIEILSLLASIIVGIGMALGGYSYWAIVGMSLTLLAANTLGAWMVTAWIPGWPQRKIGTRSLIRFGGKVTLNSIVIYVGYNLDKVLLGRFWGPSVLGIYGRAYQLINIPTDNLGSALGGVMFSALSRLQDDPGRLKNYFLRGYSLMLTLTLPTTMACAVFADDIVFVALGQKWMEASMTFRFLTPAVIVFAIINPTGYLLYAVGWVGRSLKIAMVITPLVIVGYGLGLKYGANGVAIGFSIMMILWVVPHMAWCINGTNISARDILVTIGIPFISSITASAISFFAMQKIFYSLFPIVRLGCSVSILFVLYFLMLFYVMNQKAAYFDLLRSLKKPS